MFVKLNTNKEIDQYPYSIEKFREEHNNLSLPVALSDAFLANYNVYPVYFGVEPDSFDKKTHKKVLKGAPVLIEDRWVLEWEVVQKSDYEIIIETEEFSNYIRKKRDDLLKETDWMATKAFETNTPIPEMWVIYRQQLRDVTSQEGFPYDIAWPQNPIPQ